MEWTLSNTTTLLSLEPKMFWYTNMYKFIVSIRVLRKGVTFMVRIKDSICLDPIALNSCKQVDTDPKRYNRLVYNTLSVRVNLAVISMKRYSTFPPKPRLELYNQIQFRVISWTLVREGSLTSLQRCSWCILQPQPIGLRWFSVISRTLFWKGSLTSQ